VPGLNDRGPAGPSCNASESVGPRRLCDIGTPRLVNYLVVRLRAGPEVTLCVQFPQATETSVLSLRSGPGWWSSASVNVPSSLISSDELPIITRNSPASATNCMSAA